GSAAEGLLISAPETPIESLGPTGRRFVAAFRHAVGEPPSGVAIYAGQATDVLLDAIQRSDGSRPSVVRELFRTRVRNEILGSFSIGPTGDTTQSTITVIEVRNGKAETLALIIPPRSLVRP